MSSLGNVRNIGISAHIDSGKTTLTERILYYTGRIHRMGDVKDKERGATMDHMELEKERGITITAAATTVRWAGRTINIIDTPGHVDFTVEVERSLRVLDGAILVLCGVAGVQSQSLTVDRQMRRYGVPRLAFINKLDRAGADPARAIRELETRLGHVAVPLQLPIGLEADHRGVIDLIAMKAVYFEGADGADVRVDDVPPALRPSAERARLAMLDTLSLYSDELMGLMLEGQPIAEELIHRILREQTIAREITPVLMGSAFRNRGVQPLLDAVVRYLPSPLDRVAYARDNANEGAEVALAADADATPVAMAFKIVEEPFGQLTYARIYQGTFARGQVCINTRTQTRQRIARILRMHANEREEIEAARAGDIVALLGVDCASGDTLCGEDRNLSLESIHIAEPVISMAVRPLRSADRDKMARALSRFRREDPTFHVRHDPKTGQTLISGMGELHLEIYVERIRREYGIQVEVGAPAVSYREAPTVEVPFNYRHRKQTGGAGQYAHVIGRLVPLPEDHPVDYEFENRVTGGRIPTEFIPSVDKGFQSCRGKGPLAGYEIIKVRMVLEDGTHHAVDSSDLAFQICAREAFREAFLRSRPVLLEPIVRAEIEIPLDAQGSVISDLTARRGIVRATENRGGTVVIHGEVPLANMFGYATDLRSQTQGRGTFTMEFARYSRVPPAVQDEIIARYREAERQQR